MVPFARRHGAVSFISHGIQSVAGWIRLLARGSLGVSVDSGTSARLRLAPYPLQCRIIQDHP